MPYGTPVSAPDTPYVFPEQFEIPRWVLTGHLEDEPDNTFRIVLIAGGDPGTTLDAVMQSIVDMVSARTDVSTMSSVKYYLTYQEITSTP